jgi:hypothetical protein
MLEFVDGLPLWIKITIGLNFLITAVMWLGEPVVITSDIFEASAFSAGPIILIGNTIYEPMDDYTDYALTHEYGHYLQTMILTPIIMVPSYLTSTAYSLLTTGTYYRNNFFEQQATEFGNNNLFTPRFVVHF